MLEELNLKLFALMNANASASEWQIRFAVLAAEYLIYLIPVLLVVLWLWGTSKQRSPLLLATIVAFVALGVNQLIGLAWFHPRPDVLGVGRTLFAHAAESSFPCDHMTVFWTIGLTLFCSAATKFVGATTMAVGIVVAWARVFLGVHFPLDMLGAIVISSVCFAIFIPLRPWIGQTLLPAIEKIYRIVFAIPLRRGWVR